MLAPSQRSIFERAVRGFEREHEIEPRLLHTSSRTTAGQKLICKPPVVPTSALGASHCPTGFPSQTPQSCPSHAPPRWQPSKGQQDTSLEPCPLLILGVLPTQSQAPQHVPPLQHCLPHRNPGDYNTSSSHWLLARQAKQLGCYGNFMVLIKFISGLLIKFCHYYYYYYLFF